MTLSELVQKSYQLATSKAIAPTAGSSKYQKLVSFANICTDAWQNEPGVDWNSQYMKVTLPTAITNTDTIPLSASIRKISNRKNDNIQVICLDGSVVDFTLVRPEELADYPNQNVVARVGSNLVFARTFVSDEKEFGGSVKVPCYGFAPTLSSDSDLVVVDSPLWLAYMVAAEYCRTDAQLNYLEDGLIARANEVMASMKQNNAGQVETVQRYSVGYSRTW